MCTCEDTVITREVLSPRQVWQRLSFSISSSQPLPPWPYRSAECTPESPPPPGTTAGEDRGEIRVSALARPLLGGAAPLGLSGGPLVSQWNLIMHHLVPAGWV